MEAKGCPVHKLLPEWCPQPLAHPSRLSAGVGAVVRAQLCGCVWLDSPEAPLSTGLVEDRIRFPGILG